MATQLIVKITERDAKGCTVIRRIKANAEELSFSGLKNLLESIGILRIYSKIQYKDDEGDLITISTDIETEVAVELALQSKPAVLRISINNTGAALPIDAFCNDNHVDDPFAYRLDLISGNLVRTKRAKTETTEKPSYCSTANERYVQKRDEPSYRSL